MNEFDEVSIPIYWNEASVTSPPEPAVPVDPNYIDPKFFNQVSQIAHFFTMAFLNLLWAFPFHLFGHSRWAFSGILWSVLYASWHEFVHDPDKENKATRGSDLEDFGFLMAGTGIGQIVALIFVVLAWVALG